MRPFADRICLVTGGASGIGAAVAHSLLAHGAAVYVADKNPDSMSPQQGKEPSQASFRLHRQRVDVTEYEAVEQWVQLVLRYEGQIDVLVHCAAIANWQAVDRQSVADILAVMRVGFDGMVHCTKAVLPQMQRQNSGSIVYLSSVASTIHTFPGYAAYAAMKSATDAWTRMLQVELSGSSIGVAAVRPGLTRDTRLFLQSERPDRLPRLFDLLPATTPERVAKVVLRAIQKPNRFYVTPRYYAVLEMFIRGFPRLSAWLCRWGHARRDDLKFSKAADPGSQSEGRR